MKEKQFSNIFLRPLHKEKFHLSEIDEKTYDEVLDLSNEFCMPTEVLNNLEYNPEIQNFLIKGLKEQAYISNLKKLINQRELLRISKLYNENGIEYVFMKGSAINFLCNDYVRYSRDLDILVSKKSLSRAYELLKKIGYRYLDPKVSDCSKFTAQTHHLPVLSNGNGALVEIHHRVTKKSIYKECPLSELMLQQHIRVVKNEVNINISCINHLIAHIIYHASLHHEFNLGPVFLYDINYLKNKVINKKDLENLLKKMNLNQAYKDIYEYLEKREMEDIFELYKISNKKRINKQTSRSVKYLLSTQKGRLEFLNIIIRKFKYNEDYFQTSKFSVKFYLILFIQLKDYLIKTYKY